MQGLNKEFKILVANLHSKVGLGNLWMQILKLNYQSKKELSRKTVGARAPTVPMLSATPLLLGLYLEVFPILFFPFNVSPRNSFVGFSLGVCICSAFLYKTGTKE